MTAPAGAMPGAPLPVLAPLAPCADGAACVAGAAAAGALGPLALLLDVSGCQGCHKPYMHRNMLIHISCLAMPFTSWLNSSHHISVKSGSGSRSSNTAAMPKPFVCHRCIRDTL